MEIMLSGQRSRPASKKAFYESLERAASLTQGSSARVVAELSARALGRNWEALRALARGRELIPMIKADGYGHGALWVARHLQAQESLHALGVATLQEGVEVREGLGARGRRTRILVFSGTTPWTEVCGGFCEKFGLIPVISSEEDWRAFVRGGWPARIGYHLKFNTGMNRLGLSLGAARSVAREIARWSEPEKPMGVFSHLASGEDPDSPLSRLQRSGFLALKREFSGVAPSALFHLGNSAALWNEKGWGLSEMTDLVRPGLALYGVPPWAQAPLRGVEPVLTLKASVSHVRRLKPGDRVGYGGTWRVKGGENPWVAVLSAGYADGIHRSLSNAGHAWCGGRATRFVGSVSMDLSTVLCTEQTRPGDWVEILGPRVDIWSQAKAAGTIPYELLTSISPRVQRRDGS